MHMFTMEYSYPRTNSDAKMPSTYFGFQYKMLRIFGMGAFHDPTLENFDRYPTLGYLLYSIVCIVIHMFGYWASEVMYAVKAIKDNVNVSQQSYSLVFTGVHLFGLLKMVELIRNSGRIQRVVKILEVDCKQFVEDEEILAESIRRSKIVSRCMLYVGNVTIVCTCIYTAIADITRRTQGSPRITPFLVYVPWDSSGNLGYVAAFVYSGFGMVWFGNTTMVGDTLVASILMHVSGQFKMIQRRIEHVGDDAIRNLVKKHSLQDIYCGSSIDVDDFLIKKMKLVGMIGNERFNEEILNRLKICIKYHQLMIHATEVLQQAYSQTFLIQTLASFYMIGLALFQNAKDATDGSNTFRIVNNFGVLLSAFSQLFIQTYGCNEITLEAMKISESAYSSCWYAINGDKGRFRKLLIVVMIRAQYPIYLTAGKFGKMSNEMFVSVVRSSYQIFTLMKTVLKDNK